MLDFKEKRKMKTILYSRVTIVLLGIFLAFLLHSVWGVYQKAKVAYESKSRVDADFSELKDREGALLHSIESLKTDRGIESEIRGKFGVVKSGEEVVVIVDSDSENTMDSGQKAGISGNLWQKLKGFFE